MTRGEAQKIVDAVTFKVPQAAPYPPASAVTIEDASRLIGEKHFERLMADRIRNHGPVAGTIYPWNVVDYLVPAANEKSTNSAAASSASSSTASQSHG